MQVILQRAGDRDGFGQVAFGGCFQPAAARLLQRVGPGSAVLDAACGTGVDAAVLARRGFHVRAADGSQAMVEVAAARFRREGLAIPLQRCLWADLPAAIGERFDVVLCTGNALVHAAGRGAMVQALIGLRRMARPGGYVVVDSRNWEKLHAERPIVQVMDRVKRRGGRRCVVLYAPATGHLNRWAIPRCHPRGLATQPGEWVPHFAGAGQLGRCFPWTVSCWLAWCS